MAVATPAPVPALVPEAPAVEKLLQRLVAETQSHPSPVVSPPESMGLVCFSCGKSGHAATRCPALDESFSFMLPGWRAEKTPGFFVMISPRVATERLHMENGD